jgi:uncharacterized protein (DUF302 family)
VSRAGYIFLGQINDVPFVFFTFKNKNLMNPKGVIVRQSQYSVTESIDRLQTFLLQHEATIYARINQQAEVNNAGQDLLPLEFILFGNPKGGGHLMAENPLIALDLPLKVIAWEDEQKKVWLAYNDASYIEERYTLLHIAGSPLVLDHLIDMVFKNLI